MPLRPGRCYRHFSGPAYTRKEYIPGIPQPKITKFTSGNPNGDYDYEVRLITTEIGQIRHNALEAVRTITLKTLTKRTGSETSFFMWILKYPHHVLRENKMMAFAGADRLQDGMRLSFGTPIGTAARIEKLGEILIVVKVKKEHLDFAKEALKIASKKLPLRTRIEIIPLRPIRQEVQS
ncbi:ribosomal protein L16 [Sulfolobus islandicus Y.G.57.14]|jgi:large subunit ribosomal protein L10e|uniref:Large ribosomal subunit protein uL16 n=12 Tax=Saccharolobus TaxID=2100760 RepID=RL10E_SACI1|nr:MULTISPECIES: 50S ribosomal protein L16 [Sulfolobaceae]C3MRC8.1 RecName: Full=Large ribosomal subunit protein uL16; AltName: Full=50S ribosomal protein L10e [Sulfolobus islandicus L.S.2.15]C3MXL7.1 RecName: Full=Large ribosomal subunit protein uL16; AltName: Full=50S ribosomal protein L10e [Sulfolobus islandicus M.14.25]C3MZG3.1 RecName: Full=Large ribosomal subunit protein uL16; AltName: Full=50S ribosomal protein L10e [Sulfolobus islandicus M.16.27]C3N7I5.1 RecName: Full=Large ribosomal su